MKVNNFVLLIISIITLIIISLVTECNRGRLKELEDKAEKEIKETFFTHLGSADPTEPGQWGYKITNITEGQYGGRSKQEVLNNIGSHVVGDYISEDEYSSKDDYSSSLFDITGKKKISENCNITKNDVNNGCNTFYNDNLVYEYNIIHPTYGGKSCEDIYGSNSRNIIIDSNNNSKGYEYVTNNHNVSKCINNINNNKLVKIDVIDKNNITITESTWKGFFNSAKIGELLFDDKNKLDNGNILTFNDLMVLKNNQTDSDFDNSVLYSYYKYSKESKYYNVEDNSIREYINSEQNLISTNFEGHSNGIYSVLDRKSTRLNSSHSSVSRMPSSA